MSTKKKQKKRLSAPIEASPSLSFSPVSDLAASSPLRVHGNLTGHPRKLKDIAANWYNGREKWKAVSVTGFNLCTEISDIKQDSFVDGGELPASLESLCEQLHKVIVTLKGQVDKMRRWNENVTAIAKLLQSQGTSHQVIFQTWTVEQFCESSHRLLDEYAAELRARTLISQNICHCNTKDELMFMLAAWSHEAYLDDQTQLQIDAMTIETGHFPD